MHELSAKGVLATSYAMTCIAGVATILRFFLRGLRNDAFQLEDGLMILAFVTFNILATITIIVIPIAYHTIAVDENLSPKYEGLYDDEVYQLRVLFASNIIFPMVLWLVKLSLLSLSRRLFFKQQFWMRVWWGVLGVVVLTLFISLVITLTSCTTLSNYFTPGACSAPADNRAQVANLYYVVVAEILTDVLVMALPIIFLYQVRLTRSTYIRTAGIFSVGSLCIVTAIGRGVTIGTRMWLNDPTLPWVAIWQMVEGGIAIVVGCLPTYAVYAIQVSKATKPQSSVTGESVTRPLGGHGTFRSYVTTRLPRRPDERNMHSSDKEENPFLTGVIHRTDVVEITEEYQPI